MQLQFLGAAGTVTGSKYLIQSGENRVLVDCGLFQGYKQYRLRNWEPLPDEAAYPDCVVLTHAHLDHSGYLPLLVKNGFRGKIHCSEATYELCRILLPDSGRLQEEEADYANRKGFSKHHPALPLYTEKDAKQALKLFAPHRFGERMDLGGGLSAELAPAGHILGAAIVTLRQDGLTVAFSGDLGRPNDPLMAAPAAIRHADYLLLESTYGNRRHADYDPLEVLGKTIRETAARGGVTVIPAFAVGRAQLLLHYIHRLKQTGAIPSLLPVYLDSPMAIDATSIYQRHRQEHRLSREDCLALGDAAKLVNSVEESKAIDRRQAPMVVISASGMATGGRVLHHLKAFASDPRNTILFSGYQAGGTRGASMLAGADSIKIHGDYVPLRAQVIQIDNLSAHADADEILAWLSHFSAPPKTTFIVHGEPDAADALRHRIEEQLGWKCVVPEHMQRFNLT